MTTKMPIGFIGHGSPMNIISDNSYTRSILNIGEQLPRPKAILVITAHWLSDGVTGVTTTANPDLIYDFYGFPKALYEEKYDCPGYPEIGNLLKNTTIVTTDTYGLDHGVWSILKFMYPNADIPVCALSLDIAKPGKYHYELGKTLKFLRNEGILVLGSGNIVHNLYTADIRSDLNPYDWALNFEQEAINSLEKKQFSQLIAYADEKSLPIPTTDHYLPLLYILGMVDDEDEFEMIHSEIQNRSVSQLSFFFK